MRHQVGGTQACHVALFIALEIQRQAVELQHAGIQTEDEGWLADAIQPVTVRRFERSEDMRAPSDPQR